MTNNPVEQRRTAKILIAESDEQRAEELTLLLKKNGHQITALAASLKDALGFFYSQQPDIVLINLFLGQQPDGIIFAEKINRNESTKRPFIFLANQTDKLTFKRAVSTSPYGFLLYPFKPLELQYLIELAIEKFTHEIGTFLGNTHRAIDLGNYFFVKKGNELIRLSLEDIDYVEVKGKYSLLKTKLGSFLIQKSLKDFAGHLPYQRFIRIHRNYLLNLESIDKVLLDDQHVVLKNEQSIPFSQGFKSILLKQFEILK